MIGVFYWLIIALALITLACTIPGILRRRAAGKARKAQRRREDEEWERRMADRDG